MCESLRPGMMVRRRPSITRVCGPRRCRISSSLPTAAILPAVMAIASTNEGTPFVAILALCNMSSADTAVSVSSFSKWIEKGGGNSARRFLLVNCNGSGNRVLGKFRGRRAVHHRVHVLDADPVSSVVVLHDIHNGVIRSSIGPVALPFEQDRQGRDRFCAGLNDALHRVVVSKLAHVAAAIFHDVDFVAVMKRLHSRKRNTGFRPKTGNENLLASAFFDRGDKVFVVPGVHGRTLDGFLPREYGSQLRPHIPAEGLRLDRCQNYRYIEHPCGFSECHGVVYDSLAVKIACSEQHLALMVDQRHDAIVRSQESLLTQFWTIAV